MGRILILLGVLALCAGIVVPIASSLNMIGSFGIQIEDAITPTAAEYCNSGETLETTSGPSTRANSGSFQTARVTFYFCQNSAGERREVTDAVNRDLLGGPSGFLGNISSIFTGGLAAVGFSMGGIALIIVGVLMTFRTRPRVVNQFGQPVTRINLRGGNSPVGVSPFGDSPVGVPPSSANPTQTPPNAGGMQGDVIDFVRDQLDTAYRNGQITREDYDRAIEKLNRR
jgi:hypothetical protein